MRRLVGYLLALAVEVGWAWTTVQGVRRMVRHMEFPEGWD
jgi:hypothetical protein